jgi:hypothetical protein
MTTSAFSFALNDGVFRISVRPAHVVACSGDAIMVLKPVFVRNVVHVYYAARLQGVISWGRLSGVA